MGGYNIERVPTSKSLGVHIDENLSWSGHIDETAKKISRAINGLRQVRPFVHFHTLLTIYNALILPLFDYCDVVWDNLDKGLAERIQKLQNRAARIITQSSYDIRSHDILRQLKWEPIGQRRTKHKAIMMFKIMNDKAPTYLSRQFTKVCESNPYHLRRDNSKLTLPLPKTENLKKSFKYGGAKLWNSLPENVKASTSMKYFKRMLDYYIIPTRE